MPVNPTSLFKNLWSRAKFSYHCHIFLSNRLHCIIQYSIYGFKYQFSTKHHQFIMHHFHIIRICNRYTYLLNHFSGINLVLQEKGGDACLCISINDRPVNRSCAPVLGKQRSMQIESTQPWHVPDYFRQHTKSNHNLKIRFPVTKGLHKSLIFQFLRLQQRQILFECISLDRRILNFMSASGRFIGHRYHAYHVIAALYQLTQGLHRKIGSTHINDS